MNPDRPNRVPEIKSALSDPTSVLDALGILGEGRARQRQAAGWMIRCPVHADRSPSCSVQNRGGELLWKCHSCDQGGDVLTLVAAVRGLSMSGRGFIEVLVEAARLGGLWHIVDELEGRASDVERREAPRRAAAPPPEMAPERERTWPDRGEVEALWGTCGLVSEDDEASAYLAGRGIDAAMVDALELGRVLPGRGALPRWASYRGAAAVSSTWRELGYRLIVPMFDPDGAMRSVRAWRVRLGEGPKRLPPSGHKASGLVMADTFARAMLTGSRTPDRVVVVEGEPDHFVRCIVTRSPSTAILGIVSGSWTQDFADKLPRGVRVDVRTDADDAGDRYAAEIIASVKRRCIPYRIARSAA